MNVAVKNRVGMRATYKRVNAMGGKTIVDPRSGWRKIKNIGTAKHKATCRIPFKESLIPPIFDLASMLAPMTKVAHLEISEG